MKQAARRHIAFEVHDTSVMIPCPQTKRAKPKFIQHNPFNVTDVPNRAFVQVEKLV
ncbi:MAG: hypothetical protein H0X13_02040 [Ramlibacter sp.]|nr:hypothetical protein [Ramlibacter sp.]